MTRRALSSWPSFLSLALIGIPVPTRRDRHPGRISVIDCAGRLFNITQVKPPAKLINVGGMLLTDFVECRSCCLGRREICNGHLLSVFDAASSNIAHENLLDAGGLALRNDFQCSFADFGAL